MSSNARVICTVAIAVIVGKPLNVRAEDSQIMRGSYLPASFCAPRMQEFAEYLLSVKATATTEDVQQELQKVIATIRTEEQKLADSQPNAAVRYLTLIKLGNKYLSKSTLLTDTRLTKVDRHDRCTKSDTRDKFIPALADLKKSTEIFRKTVAEYRDLPAADKALYGLIVSLVRMAHENAPQFNTIFQQRYPKSPLAGWANLAIGEYYFQKSDWQASANTFRLATKQNDPAIKAYAYYKLGWTEVMQLDTRQEERTQRLKNSLFNFKTSASLAAKNTSRTSRYALTREALRDLALIWAEEDDIDAAAAYFQGKSVKPYFHLFLARLGNRLFAQGYAAEASRAFLKLVRETPNHRDNPAIYEQILELTYTSRNPEWVVEILRDMVAQYLGNSRWRQDFKNDYEALQQASAAVERGLLNYASRLAKAGESKGDKALMSAAAELHAIYLGQFSQTKVAYDIRFAHATLLAKLGKHREAVQQFLITTKSRGPSGSHYKEAWREAIRQQEIIVQSIEQKNEDEQSSTTVKSLPAEFNQLVRIIDEAPTFVPHEEFQAESRLRAAEIYLRYGILDNAAKRFAKIVIDFPDTAAGAKAASRLLSDYRKRGDWVALLSWARRLDQTPAINRGAMAAVIKSYLHEALLTRANTEAKRGEFRAAAKYSLAFSERFPRDPYADAALYNATIAYLRDGALTDGITTGARFINDFPHSKYRPEVLSAIADANAALFNFASAARYFSELALSYPQDPRATNALFNAAISQRSLAKYAEAAKLFELFVQKFPNDQRAVRAMVETALAYDRAAHQSSQGGDDSLPLRMLANREDIPTSLKTPLTKAQRAHRDAVWTLLQSARQRAGGTQIDPETRRAIAEAMFQIAYHDSLPILANRTLPKRRFVEQVNLRVAAVYQLVAKFKDIEQLGDAEYAIAAQTVSAQLLESLAATLFSPPDMIFINEGDVESLKGQWEKQALEAQSLAQRYYETAASAAAHSGNLSPWAHLAKTKTAQTEGSADLLELYASPAFLTFKPGKSSTKSDGYLYSVDRRPWRVDHSAAANDEVRTTSDTLKNIPGDATNRLRRASAYLYLGRFKDAETDIRQILKLNYKNQTAQLGMAKLALVNQKSEQVNAILANFAPTTPAESEGYVILAIATLLRGDMVSAKQLLDTAISLNPNDAAAFVNIGLLYLEFRQFDLAESALEKARDLTSNDSNVLIHLAVIKSALGQFKNAENLLKEAASNGGDPALITFNQAVIKHKLGDYNNALGYLSRYTGLVKDRPDYLIRAEKLRTAIDTSRAFNTMMPTLLDD